MIPTAAELTALLESEVAGSPVESSLVVYSQDVRKAMRAERLARLAAAGVIEAKRVGVRIEKE